jgi:arylsulfatase A-like enzyme
MSSAPAAAATPARVGDLLMLAAAIGLVQGYLEVATLAVRRLSHPFLMLGRDTLWLAPVGNLLLFFVAALAMTILLTGVRTQTSFRPIVGTLIAGGSFAILMIPGGLRISAAGLLALGIGVRLSSLLSRHRSAVIRTGRVVFLILAGLTISLGVGLHLVFRWREWQAEVQLPPSRPGAPNVVLIVLDAVRAQSLGLYGATRPTTPALQTWAAGGVVFDRAIATSSWTLPTHASMFTGRQADELTVDWETPLDTRFPTLAEILGANGYRTAGFVGNLHYCSYESGLARGFQHYEDYPVSWGTLFASTASGRMLLGEFRLRRLLGWYEIIWRKPAATITASVFRWIDDHRNRPFFAFVNYYDAHSPYLPPPDLAERFGQSLRRQDPLQSATTKWTAEGITAERAAYEGSIAAIDRSLAVLFAGLERRGLRDSTLVIVTSDHGEEFKEHGELLHGHNLFMTSVHVPLILRWPGRIPSGRRIQRTVSLRRIAATVEDLSGVGTKRLPGQSLRNLWDFKEPQPPAERWALSLLRRNPVASPTSPSSGGDQVALTNDTLRVLFDRQDSMHVYLTALDPGETNPLPNLPVQLRAEVDSIVGAIRARRRASGSLP